MLNGTHHPFPDLPLEKIAVCLKWLEGFYSISHLQYSRFNNFNLIPILFKKPAAAILFFAFDTVPFDSGIALGIKPSNETHRTFHDRIFIIVVCQKFMKGSHAVPHFQSHWIDLPYN